MNLVTLKSPREIEKMRRSGKVASQARALAGSMVEPGVSTLDIDREVRKFIRSHGARPSFLHYNGFPNSACISLNDTVIHGIPERKKVLVEGDIVSVDVGADLDGYHGDCCGTFGCGTISSEAQRLIDVTRQSFFEGIKMARIGNRISDISHGIQTYVEQHGFSVVRDFVGHGIGTRLHEPPEVPNYGAPSRGQRLEAGMTLAIEPMVNAGTYKVRVLSDGWTTVTQDGSLAAHYENTILITQNEPEILTVLGGDV